MIENMAFLIVGALIGSVVHSLLIAPKIKELTESVIELKIAVAKLSAIVESHNISDKW